MKVATDPTTITNKTIKKATGIPTDNPTIKPKFDPPSPSKAQKRKVTTEAQTGKREHGIKPEDEVP